MRARRVDANLSAIVQVARDIGLKVNVRNDDLADLDVQFGGHHEVWEVKGSRGRLTERQKKLRGDGWCIRLIKTADDVLEAKKTMLHDLDAIKKARLLNA